MTSYEEKLKQLAKRVDETPKTQDFVRTIGFGSEPNTPPSNPVSIPTRATSAPVSLSSPRGSSSFSDSLSSSPKMSTSAGKKPIESPKEEKKVLAKVEPADPPKKMSKEERKALYEKQAQVAHQRKLQNKQADTQATPEAAAKPKQEKQEKPPPPQQQKEQQPKQEKQPKPPKLQQDNATPSQPPQQQQQQPQKPPKEKQEKPPKQPQKEGSAKEIKPAATPLQADDTKKMNKALKKKIVAPSTPTTQKQVSLFSHLPQHAAIPATVINSEIHPAILELGLKYSQGIILGSNARCVGMLEAFQQVIKDFESPTSDFFRDFDIKPLVQYLVDCRPISVSMGNAINYIKLALGAVKGMPEKKAKESVLGEIEKFIQERILIADEMIVKYGLSKITDGDVILTYARSHVVELLLTQAHKEGKKFKVVIVDSRPKQEGKELLRRLVHIGIKCTFVLLSSMSYIMPNVTKVFVGAYTMMANGNLISRVGTALVAMMAKSFHIPFIVCCETYKFVERVQLESISFNELGDPEELVKRSNDDDSTLTQWKEMPGLKILNLAYDLTPMEFIVMVITEVGMVPATSVPVIIREYRKEPQ